jgi:hypothetical protein
MHIHILPTLYRVVQNYIFFSLISLFLVRFGWNKNFFDDFAKKKEISIHKLKILLQGSNRGAESFLNNFQSKLGQMLVWHKKMLLRNFQWNPTRNNKCRAKIVKILHSQICLWMDLKDCKIIKDKGVSIWNIFQSNWIEKWAKFFKKHIVNNPLVFHILSNFNKHDLSLTCSLTKSLNLYRWPASLLKVLPNICIIETMKFFKIYHRCDRLRKNDIIIWDHL